MLLLNDDVYLETKELVLAKRLPSPLLIELSNWFRTVLSIKIVNFQFSKLSTDRTHGLYVIIESTTDFLQMYASPLELNKNYQQQVAFAFREMALQHRFADASQLQNLFVTYNDFSEEARTDANWKAASEVEKQIKRMFPSVWATQAEFSNSVVFYYTDADIAANEKNGTSKAIADTYYSILTSYDELKYFSRNTINLGFDSKENLDKNFKGSLFLYSRR